MCGETLLELKSEEELNMLKPILWRVVALLAVFAIVLAACGGAAPAADTQAPADETEAMDEGEEGGGGEEAFVIGMLLVGPFNDRGWSQAHYEAGLYAEENMPGVELVYIDKVNTADRPGTTPEQLAEDLLAEGADLIVFNSDDMRDGALTFAQAHEDVPVLHVSGDHAWQEGMNHSDQSNLSNVMGQMIYGKMMAGCAAALTTQTGNIGYLGPLINDETRRLASSAYLGARYCWEEVLGNDPAELGFRVTWIGFWFNIPGVTSDPTQVADDFFNSGFDVVISGIDTTEALVEASRFASEGQDVWAVPYDFEGACSEGPDVCLGVPYFNWGPAYVKAIGLTQSGSWEQYWDWNPPYWSNINDHDESAIGFVEGDALGEEAAGQVDELISALGGGLNLWVGPINLQDGTTYLEDGVEASLTEIWYLPQLLEGMEGQSVPEAE